MDDHLESRLDGRTQQRPLYAERVRAVMDHVRANLTDDLTLEELSEVAHFSRFHFHRIFRAMTGETLADFTRRARLDRALYLMKSAPTKTLGSIALASGFTSHSDFSRVFRSAFGMPPSRWDRVQVLTRATVRPAADLVEGGPGRFGAPSTPIQAAVRAHDAATLAYIRVSDPWTSDRLAQSFGLLTDHLDARGVDWRTAPMIGLSWDSYDATPLDKVTFDLAFAVGQDVPIDHGPVGSYELPAITSIDARAEGPLLRMAQAWDHIYLEWLPSSGYEPADLPALTRFRRRPDETGWQNWDVDCCVALQRLTP